MVNLNHRNLLDRTSADEAFLALSVQSVFRTAGNIDRPRIASGSQTCIWWTHPRQMVSDLDAEVCQSGHVERLALMDSGSRCAKALLQPLVV
jgi:hypothetical protein